MNFHEYQTKEIFAKYSILIPRGRVIETPQQAYDTFVGLKSARCAVKIQIHAGGRGKAGGIKLVKSPDEAKSVAQNLLNKPIITHQTGPQGKIVHKLLVEEACDIAKELYVGAVVDRNANCPVIMLSSEGGVEIEELAARSPEKIFKEQVEVATGLKPFQARKLAYKLGLNAPLISKMSSLLTNFTKLFIERDCSLLEINPLVITKAGEILALDAKMNIDDRAIEIHPELEEMRDISEEDPLEFEASKAGVTYISMTGNIGCMVNGAGLAMSTMDIIKLHGGMPANFLDVGGGASKEQVAIAFKLLLANKNVKAVLINIFGGILRCDVLAQGILDALKEVKVNMPVVVRLEGTNVEKGRELLASSGLSIITATDMTDAAKKVVKVAG